MVISWDLMGFIRIYDGMPSDYVTRAIAHGHRKFVDLPIERWGFSVVM